MTFAPKMEDKHFQSDKARILLKVDLSRKGSVDGPIRDLVEYINGKDSFYTTSSCSGRVTVFSEVRKFVKLTGPYVHRGSSWGSGSEEPPFDLHHTCMVLM